MAISKRDAVEEFIQTTPCICSTVDVAECLTCCYDPIYCGRTPLEPQPYPVPVPVPAPTPDPVVKPQPDDNNHRIWLAIFICGGIVAISILFTVVMLCSYSKWMKRQDQAEDALGLDSDFGMLQGTT